MYYQIGGNITNTFLFHCNLPTGMRIKILNISHLEPRDTWQKLISLGQPVLYSNLLLVLLNSHQYLEQFY